MLTPEKIEQLYLAINNSPFGEKYKTFDWYLAPWTLSEEEYTNIIQQTKADEGVFSEALQSATSKDKKVGMQVYTALHEADLALMHDEEAADASQDEEDLLSLEKQI